MLYPCVNLECEGLEVVQRGKRPDKGVYRFVFLKSDDRNLDFQMF